MDTLGLFLELVGWIGTLVILVWWGWSSRTVPATKCGHRTHTIGSVMIFGKPMAFRLLVENGETDYCLECIGKMAIRCAWCSNPIAIGDAVTLRPPVAGRKLVNSNGCASDEAGRYLGCLKCGCLRSEEKGVWAFPGRVRLFPVLWEPVRAQD